MVRIWVSLSNKMPGKTPGVGGWGGWCAKAAEIFSIRSWKISFPANPVDIAAGLNGIPVLCMK